MKRFVQAEDRTQGVLLPEHLDDYVGADRGGPAQLDRISGFQSDPSAG